MERTYGAATKLLMHNSTKTCVNVGMGTVVQWLETSPQSNAVMCSNHSWGPSIWSLHVDYKLVVAQNESSEWSCVSLCCPCDRLVTCPECTPPPAPWLQGWAHPSLLYFTETEHTYIYMQTVLKRRISQLSNTFLGGTFLIWPFSVSRKSRKTVF